MPEWFVIALGLLAFAIICFGIFFGVSRRNLLPLVELLDQQSSEPTKSDTLDGNSLYGHYQGRSVKCSIEVPESEEVGSEFRVALSCNAPWTFDVAKRSRLGRNPNPNRWEEKFSLGSKLSEAKFGGSYSKAGTESNQQLIAWTQMKEIRDMQLNNLQIYLDARLGKKSPKIQLTHEVEELILPLNKDRIQFGARVIKRAIYRHIVLPLSEYLLTNQTGTLEFSLDANQKVQIERVD